MKYLVILLLTGCAAGGWKMPRDDGSLDYKECRYEAHKVEAASPNIGFGMIEAREAMERCLDIRRARKAQNAPL